MWAWVWALNGEGEKAEAGAAGGEAGGEGGDGVHTQRNYWPQRSRAVGKSRLHMTAGFVTQKKKYFVNLQTIIALFYICSKYYV